MTSGLTVGGPGDGPIEQWCQDHWDEVRDQLGEQSLVGAMALVQFCLADERFYEIAYRIKNGYGPPEQYNEDDDWTVPEGERPDNEHINAAMAELSPLCCWLEEEREKFEELIEAANGERPMPGEEVDDEH